jgi:hypothetical protein
MSNQAIKFHENKTIPIELPSPTGTTFVDIKLKSGKNDLSFIIEVYKTKDIKGLTNKVIQHYIYNQLSSYLTLFSIDDEYNIESFNFIDS